MVSGKSWLRALGLHRREVRAWAMYDWANSAFATTVMAAVFPVYYINVATSTVPEELRTAYWGYTQTIAVIIIALISPILGAAADFLGAKKKFLLAFVALGIAASALLYFAGDGQWFFASAIFILGNIGFAAGNVFYESLLPHLASEEEMDRVSAAGYAIGYVGGGLLLAIQTLWFVSPETFGMSDNSEAARWAFLSVAVWWAVFSIPFFRTVPEPPRRLEADERADSNPLWIGFARIAETFREIRAFRHLFVFLLAFWFYNDGINTIIKMAAAYGAEIGIGTVHLMGALLIVQFLGIPATFAYGALAERIGTKPGIYLALVIYSGICVFAYFMSEAWHFYALAVVVGLVQGGSQALSRSLFATLVPPHKSSEFFGFYSIAGKFGNIAGPLVFAVVASLTGGGRTAILALIGFFALGLFLLSRVDVEEGRRAARAAEASLQS